MPMVEGCQLAAVAAGHLFMRELLTGRLEVVFANDREFHGCWTSRKAARTIEAVSVDDGPVDDRLAVRIPNDGCVHVGEGRVVAEEAAAPNASKEAHAGV